jgi:hypothetical protein
MHEWMRILELENWRVHKTSVVCENHFKLTDMTGTERKRLIVTAKLLSVVARSIRSQIHFKL